MMGIMITEKQSTGKRGEQIAAEYLQAQGYTINARNWHCTHGEIDIVAQCEGVLCFVEVRTRHAQSNEAAFASITARKRERMVKSAYAYLDAHDQPQQTRWRIDMIAVALRSDGAPLIEHVEDALGW